MRSSVSVVSKLLLQTGIDVRRADGFEGGAISVAGCDSSCGTASVPVALDPTQPEPASRYSLPQSRPAHQ